ncbi:hypothetical protein ECC06_04220 [Helicobacter pylori]|nr:hypothetical protein ECC06_04220 [Helicobacter pylori]
MINTYQSYCCCDQIRVIVVVIKSYCHNYSLKSLLVMKTALFKLLNQTIIPRYATNHNIKFQTRLSPPFFKYQFFIPLI